MLDCFVFVYLNDILIFSRSLEEHIQNVWNVLLRILDKKLCHLHTTSVDFLGFVIEQGQVRMDPSEVQAVTNFPAPGNYKQLQCFLGFADIYHSFIRD